MAMLSQLGLLGPFVSTRMAKLAFLWSRIRVCDDYGDASTLRLRHLTFEGFMEAIIRLATMVPLPVDVDIEEMGCADGGEYLCTLQVAGAQAFNAFVAARRQHWAAKPRQAIWRCADHLISLMIRV